MRRSCVAALLACGLVPVASAEPVETIAAKVRAREVAFAKSMAGTYNSTWRLERDGEWRIVLDNGCPPCRCP